MFKWLALLALLWATPAWAQNPTCPTRPPGDSTNACASTAFVQQNGGGGTGAGGDLSGTYPNPTVVNGSHITNSSIPNSGLVNPSTTVNGQSCTLGSTCSITIPGTIINVTNYGTTGNGIADDAAAIQSAINAAGGSTTLPGIVFFPCGTYLIKSATLLLPSNITLQGAGWCAHLEADPSLPTYGAWFTATGQHSNFIAINNNLTGGNSNITVSNLEFDTSAFNVSANGDVSLMLRNVSGALITNNYFYEGQDGFAQTKSSNTNVFFNYAYGQTNASLDAWDGNTNINISNNNIDDAGNTGVYGIDVTALVTLANATSNIDGVVISGNNIRNVGQVGIWIQGGWTGSACGNITNYMVTNNRINNVTQYDGIRLDAAQDGVVANNTIQSAASIPISVLSEDASCSVQYADIHDNIILHNVANEAIDVAEAQWVNVHDNNIHGTLFNYCVAVESSSSNVDVYANTCNNWVTAPVADAGTNDNIGQVCAPGSPSSSFATQNGFVKHC